MPDEKRIAFQLESKCGGFCVVRNPRIQEFSNAPNMVRRFYDLGAVTRCPVAPEAFFWMLLLGIFVVLFPAVFVAPEVRRQCEPEGFMEGRLERFARLNALYGVRLFSLCHGEFPCVHDEGSQWS